MLGVRIKALDSPQIHTPLFQWLMSASLPGDNEDAPSSLRSAPCTPRKSSGRGHLVALRTKAEVDTTLQTLEAYIADVPRNSANSVLRYVTLFAI